MGVKNALLLTGAGFSKNFGGFLASELWGRIFSHPALINFRSSKTWMHDNFDYESVYYRVLKSETLSAEEKTAITEAVLHTYNVQENIFAAWSDKSGPPCPINVEVFQREFLAPFAGDEKDKGFIFTLNQDMLMERYASIQPSLHVVGVENDPAWFTDRFTGIKAQDIPTIKLNLPTGAAFKLADCKPFSYVKIHGSINFRSAQTNQLVIGEQKDNFMQEPFMTASTKLFEEVISQPERRLLVAGYGFNDLTLNVILAQAITKASLKLYILSTMPPKDLKNTIINSGSGKMVWNGVNGYFQNSLQELFPPNQEKSLAWDTIRKAVIDG